MSTRQHRVLVVDNVPTFRGSVVRRPELGGIEIEEAGCGLEVLRIHDSKPVGLIVPDMRTPEMDGLETQACLGEFEGRPLVVAMTRGGPNTLCGHPSLSINVFGPQPRHYRMSREELVA